MLTLTYPQLQSDDPKDGIIELPVHILYNFQYLPVDLDFITADQVGKILQSVLVLLIMVWLFAGAMFHNGQSPISESLRQFKLDSKILTGRLVELGDALDHMESGDPGSISKAKNALVNSRLAYKRIEYFMEYFFASSSRIYNRAPKHEVEEPFMEFQPPAGFQYIEQMLFDSLPATHKQELLDQVKLLSLSSENLNALLYKFPGSEGQILESIRLELIRIIALGITGFDAPSLKTGIQEAKVSMEAVQDIMYVYSNQKNISMDSVDFYLETSIQYLGKNSDFDSFDRMHFLTHHALPLQTHLGVLIKNLNIEVNTNRGLNYNAKHIFSPEALNVKSFSSRKKTASLAEINLGKRLFFDKRLSGNNSKNCASCHDPNRYFSDGLPKSMGFLPNAFVKRNAPSLLYAGFQRSQFWDGRVKSLEKQVENVIKDPTEMHGNLAAIVKKLNTDKAYQRAFQKAFVKKTSDKIKEKEIYTAIASYVSTLNPFNSRFDQYINGEKKSLTEIEINGFNLFMGKAQCGTCHFAPLFNGLVPPAFLMTEFEVLGTPENDDLDRALMDQDEGRFSFFPISFYKNAFKTPTVRNSAETGPYMHNGAISTLETVIDFYDRGGGIGLGLDFSNQTLSSARLNLTEQEKQNIIAFLKALTDDL